MVYLFQVVQMSVDISDSLSPDYWQLDCPIRQTHLINRERSGVGVQEKRQWKGCRKAEKQTNNGRWDC